MLRGTARLSLFLLLSGCVLISKEDQWWLWPDTAEPGSSSGDTDTQGNADADADGGSGADADAGLAVGADPLRALDGERECDAASGSAAAERVGVCEARGIVPIESGCWIEVP